MKNVCLPSLFAVVVFGLVVPLEVCAGDYTASLYAQYLSATVSGRMTADDAGNLYIAHYDDGKVVKIDPARKDSILASGLGNLYDIAWGGGTAYGSYLYATSRTSDPYYGHTVRKIDADTGSAESAAMESPFHSPSAIGIDRTGNYNGLLYVGTASNDRIAIVSTTGTVSTFSYWPGRVDGGGVYGLSFDPSGKYGGKMFLATIFQEQNANISGLFKMEPNGSVSRFIPGLASALNVDFDPVGTYFDNDMFVLGRINFSDPMVLWRVFTDGSYQPFMSDVRSFAFGDDGAMYVSQYNWSTQEVSIFRVIPEPATLLLLAAGGVLLRKRRG